MSRVLLARGSGAAAGELARGVLAEAEAEGDAEVVAAARAVLGERDGASAGA